MLPFHPLVLVKSTSYLKFTQKDTDCAVQQIIFYLRVPFFATGSHCISWKAWIWYIDQTELKLTEAYQPLP